MSELRIEPARLRLEAGRIVSDAYGDIYFSRDDGLAETRHVFLAGNDLAARFWAFVAPEARGGESPDPGLADVFNIGELGFGTGLNFLATWHEFRSAAPPDLRLAYFSCEKHPIPAETLAVALAAFPDLAELASELVRA